MCDSETRLREIWTHLGDCARSTLFVTVIQKHGANAFSPVGIVEKNTLFTWTRSRPTISQHGLGVLSKRGQPRGFVSPLEGNVKVQRGVIAVSFEILVHERATQTSL